jgi:hypothetical protein
VKHRRRKHPAVCYVPNSGAIGLSYWEIVKLMENVSELAECGETWGLKVVYSSGFHVNSKPWECENKAFDFVLDNVRVTSTDITKII